MHLPEDGHKSGQNVWGENYAYNISIQDFFLHRAL